MASNYTEQYKLCQWEATDQVLRTDFNEDNQKIEVELTRLSSEATRLDAEKANASSFSTMVDILAETNRTLNALIPRVEALEAKLQ